MLQINSMSEELIPQCQPSCCHHILCHSAGQSRLYQDMSCTLHFTHGHMVAALLLWADFSVSMLHTSVSHSELQSALVALQATLMTPQ